MAAAWYIRHTRAAPHRIASEPRRQRRMSARAAPPGAGVICVGTDHLAQQLARARLAHPAGGGPRVGVKMEMEEWKAPYKPEQGYTDSHLDLARADYRSFFQPEHSEPAVFETICMRLLATPADYQDAKEAPKRRRPESEEEEEDSDHQVRGRPTRFSAFLEALSVLVGSPENFAASHLPKQVSGADLNSLTREGIYALLFASAFRRLALEVKEAHGRAPPDQQAGDDLPPGCVAPAKTAAKLLAGLVRAAQNFRADETASPAGAKTYAALLSLFGVYSKEHVALFAIQIKGCEGDDVPHLLRWVDVRFEDTRLTVTLSFHPGIRAYREQGLPPSPAHYETSVNPWSHLFSNLPSIFFAVADNLSALELRALALACKEVGQSPRATPETVEPDREIKEEHFWAELAPLRRWREVAESFVSHVLEHAGFRTPHRLAAEKANGGEEINVDPNNDRANFATIYTNHIKDESLIAYLRPMVRDCETFVQMCGSRPGGPAAPTGDWVGRWSEKKTEHMAILDRMKRLLRWLVKSDTRDSRPANRHHGMLNAAVYAGYGVADGADGRPIVFALNGKTEVYEVEDGPSVISALCELFCRHAEKMHWTEPRFRVTKSGKFVRSAELEQAARDRSLEKEPLSLAEEAGRRWLASRSEQQRARVPRTDGQRYLQLAHELQALLQPPMQRKHPMLEVFEATSGSSRLVAVTRAAIDKSAEGTDTADAAYHAVRVWNRTYNGVELPYEDLGTQASGYEGNLESRVAASDAVMRAGRHCMSFTAQSNLELFCGVIPNYKKTPRTLRKTPPPPGIFAWKEYPASFGVESDSALKRHELEGPQNNAEYYWDGVSVLDTDEDARDVSRKVTTLVHRQMLESYAPCFFDMREQTGLSSTRYRRGFESGRSAANAVGGGIANTTDQYKQWGGLGTEYDEIEMPDPDDDTAVAVGDRVTMVLDLDASVWDRGRATEYGWDSHTYFELGFYPNSRQHKDKRPIRDPWLNDMPSAGDEAPEADWSAGSWNGPSGPGTMTIYVNDEYRGVMTAGVNTPIDAGSDAVTRHWLLSPGELHIVSADGRWVRVRSARTGRIKGTVSSRLRADATAVQISPSGTLIAAVDEGGTAYLWDATTGAFVHEWRSDVPMNSVQFNHDSSQFVAAGSAGTVRLFQCSRPFRVRGSPRHAEHWTTDAHVGEVFSAQFSPFQPYIASAGTDGTVKMWTFDLGGDRRRPWRCETTIPVSIDSSVSSAQYSPDGNRIVTSGSDGMVRVYDIEDFHVDPRIPPLLLWASPVEGGHPVGQAPRIHALSAQFSPDGLRIVSTGAGNDATLWHAESGERDGNCTGLGGEVTHVEFSPDGRQILAVSWSGTFMVWDAETRATVLNSRLHRAGTPTPAAVTSAQFGAIKNGPGAREQGMMWPWEREWRGHLNRDIAVETETEGYRGPHFSEAPSYSNRDAEFVKRQRENLGWSWAVALRCTSEPRETLVGTQVVVDDAPWLDDWDAAEWIAQDASEHERAAVGVDADGLRVDARHDYYERGLVRGNLKRKDLREVYSDPFGDEFLSARRVWPMEDPHMNEEEEDEDEGPAISCTGRRKPPEKSGEWLKLVRQVRALRKDVVFCNADQRLALSDGGARVSVMAVRDYAGHLPFELEPRLMATTAPYMSRGRHYARFTVKRGRAHGRAPRTAPVSFGVTQDVSAARHDGFGAFFVANEAGKSGYIRTRPVADDPGGEAGCIAVEFPREPAAIGGDDSFCLLLDLDRDTLEVFHDGELLVGADGTGFMAHGADPMVSLRDGDVAFGGRSREKMAAEGRSARRFGDEAGTAGQPAAFFEQRWLGHWESVQAAGAQPDAPYGWAVELPEGDDDVDCSVSVEVLDAASAPKLNPDNAADLSVTVHRRVHEHTTAFSAAKAQEVADIILRLPGADVRTLVLPENEQRWMHAVEEAVGQLRVSAQEQRATLAARDEGYLKQRAAELGANFYRTDTPAELVEVVLLAEHARQHPVYATVTFSDAPNLEIYCDGDGWGRKYSQFWTAPRGVELHDHRFAETTRRGAAQQTADPSLAVAFDVTPPAFDATPPP